MVFNSVVLLSVPKKIVPKNYSQGMFREKILMEEKISKICKKVSLNIPYNCLLCFYLPYIVFVSKYCNLKRFYL